MKSLFILLLAGWFATIGLVACTQQIEPPAVATPTEPAAEETTMPIPANAEQLVSQAKEDLAQRLNVAAEEVQVVEVEEVTWRDSSLGCPQPGMAYTQVLVNGTQIQLEANGQIYHYHSGGGRQPFLCENPQEPLPPGQGGLDDT